MKWVHQLNIFLSFEWRTQIILKILRKIWNFHNDSQDYWNGNSRKFTKFKTITDLMRQVSFYTLENIRKPQASPYFKRSVPWNGSKVSITLWRPIPAKICLLKVNNKNTRKRCEISSKLTIKTLERLLSIPPENVRKSLVFWCFQGV